MCHPVGCAWHIYVNGRCIVVLLQKNTGAAEQGGGGMGGNLRSATKRTSSTFSPFLVSRNTKLCVQL